MFDIWGPYPLQSPEWHDVDAFYREIRADATEKVE